MIKQLHITGMHMQVGEDLHKYVTKKLARLDRYVPKTSRESLKMDVKLKEDKKKGQKLCTCEVIVSLPQETITITEDTINIFAAVDIAETRLRGQLRRYKDLHANPRLHRRIIARLKHRPV